MSKFTVTDMTGKLIAEIDDDHFDNVLEDAVVSLGEVVAAGVILKPDNGDYFQLEPGLWVPEKPGSSILNIFEKMGVHMKEELAEQATSFENFGEGMEYLADTIKELAWARTPADELAEVIPDLAEVVDCPVCSQKEIHQAEPITYRYELGFLVQHLNDHHGWRREYIADWLDTLPLDLTFGPASTGD